MGWHRVKLCILAATSRQWQTWSGIQQGICNRVSKSTQTVREAVATSNSLHMSMQKDCNSRKSRTRTTQIPSPSRVSRGLVVVVHSDLFRPSLSLILSTMPCLGSSLLSPDEPPPEFLAVLSLVCSAALLVLHHIRVMG